MVIEYGLSPTVFFGGDCPLGSWLRPDKKIALERLARPVLNVQSPPLSSVQRCGDCGLWSCFAIGFGDIS